MKPYYKDEFNKTVETINKLKTKEQNIPWLKKGTKYEEFWFTKERKF